MKIGPSSLGPQFVAFNEDKGKEESSVPWLYGAETDRDWVDLCDARFPPGRVRCRFGGGSISFIGEDILSD